jgi:uncharacterized delta-60 repeat protein
VKHRNRCPNLVQLEGREVPAVIGALDPSFGTGGKVTTDFGFTDVATAVAVQKDGKILAVGYDDGGAPDFAIARYNPDGSLDTTFNATATPTGFNGNGRLSFTFGAPIFGGSEKASAVAIQDDGKIVVAGYTDAGGGTANNFAVARINPDGTLDPTFGVGGKQTLDIGFDDRATGVAIQDDGKIVVGGFDDGGFADFAVVRFNTNGILDTTFNAAGTGAVGSAPGILTFNFGALGVVEKANALAIQTDGKIVMAGFTGLGGAVGNPNNFALARVNPDGTLDATFGAGGKQSIDFGFDDQATSVVLQPDGKIVAAGFDDGGSADFALVRLNPDGSLDTTFNDVATPTGFNGDGRLSFTFGAPVFGGVEKAHALAIQPDGRLVVVGTTDAGGGTVNNVGVARINTDGTLDTTFDADGKAIIDLGGNDEGNGVALASDGRVVVAGTSGGNFALARLFGSVGSDNQAIATGTADGKGVLYTVAPGGTQFTSPGTTIDLLPGTAAENVKAAVGDVNGDGVLDRVVVSGPGTPVTLSVRSGVDNSVLVSPFEVFENTFTGGAFVAVADLNGDGKAEVVVSPDQGGGPVVAVYSGSKLTAGSTGDAAQIVRFFGIDDPAFRGGARVALGDVNADGTPDLIVSAGFLGGPRIAVFTGKDIATGSSTPARLVNDFFAFEDTVRNGVFVSAGDIDGDGFDDLVFGGGPTAGPRVRVASGKVLLSVPGLTSLDTSVPSTPGLQIGNFFAGDPATRGGVPVAVKNVDGDGKADVVAASGENLSGFPALPSRVLVYLDQTVLGGSSTPAADQSLDPFASAELTHGVFVG